jgi:uncharacterized membrane protein
MELASILQTGCTAMFSLAEGIKRRHVRDWGRNWLVFIGVISVLLSSFTPALQFLAWTRRAKDLEAKIGGGNDWKMLVHRNLIGLLTSNGKC